MKYKIKKSLKLSVSAHQKNNTKPHCLKKSCTTSSAAKPRRRRLTSISTRNHSKKARISLVSNNKPLNRTRGRSWGLVSPSQATPAWIGEWSRTMCSAWPMQMRGRRPSCLKTLWSQKEYRIYKESVNKYHLSVNDLDGNPILKFCPAVILHFKSLTT